MDFGPMVHFLSQAALQIIDNKDKLFPSPSNNTNSTASTGSNNRIKNNPSIDSLFPFSPKALEYKSKLLQFMDKYIYPNEKVFEEQLMSDNGKNKWKRPPIFFELQEKAKQEGLWNLFLPDEKVIIRSHK